MKYFISLIVSIITLFVIELFLQLFLPFSFATIGHVNSKNAALYGWGYNSHELIKIRDPDTGQVYSDMTNNHGWRDKDRTFSNPSKSYRILVIGDSFTFGAIVPAEKVYTRVLEDMLNDSGFNVEVINMAYGGWGTDQELEALETEGLKYRPQLVIMQFHLNDLREIMYFSNADKLRIKWVPFYYELDSDHLLRHKNPYFKNKGSWRDTVKGVLLKSEIGKRLYSLYVVDKLRESPRSRTKNNTPAYHDQNVTYCVTRNQIEQLVLSINLNTTSQFYKYLNENINEEIDPNRLNDLLESCNYQGDRDIIFRVLEKRSFHSNWSREIFYPKKQDINSRPWKLYFKLIDKANSLINQMGSRLVIFCTNDLAHFEWNVYWCRLSGDATSRDNFLQYCRILREYASENSIGFIENRRLYQFARNDPHPNIAGNQAMAEDIYDFLMEDNQSELEPYRSRRPAK